LIIQLA